MKHLSQIQSEFLKNAVWEDNPEGYQRQYLRRHPKSKKRLRVRPIVQINQQNPEAETIEILKEFSKLPYDSFYGDSLHTTRDLLKQEKPSLYDLYRIMDRWYGIATNSVYQQQNPEKVEKIGLLTRALKDKEQQKLIDEAKRQTAESLTVDDENYLYSLQQKDPMIKDLADDILKDVREKGIGQKDEATGVSGEDLESIDLITKDIIQKMKDRRKSTNKMPTNEDIGNEVDEQLDDESTDIKERVKKEVARILQEESSSFADRLSEADKVVHPVEKEWNYPIMTKYGYVPDTKEGIGFVRSYKYHHPKTNNTIIWNVGVNATYWESKDPSGFGYWSDLEPFLKKIQQQVQ